MLGSTHTNHLTSGCFFQGWRALGGVGRWPRLTVNATHTHSDHQLTMPSEGNGCGKSMTGRLLLESASSEQHACAVPYGVTASDFATLLYSLEFTLTRPASSDTQNAQPRRSTSELLDTKKLDVSFESQRQLIQDEVSIDAINQHSAHPCLLSMNKWQSREFLESRFETRSPP